MPYQILTRRSSGSFAMFVGTAKGVLAELEALRDEGQLDASVRDLDGNIFDWASLVLRMTGETLNSRGEAVTPV